MLEFAMGFVTASVIFTYFSTLGLKIELAVHSSWDWIKSKTGIGPAKLP